LLIDKGLLEEVDSRPITFKTTSNGIKLMEELESIRRKIPEIYNIPSTGKNLA